MISKLQQTFWKTLQAIGSAAGQVRDKLRHVARQVSDKLRRVTGQARDGSARIARQVRDGSGRITGQARDGSARIARQVRDGSGRITGQARDRLGHIVRQANKGLLRLAPGAENRQELFGQWVQARRRRARRLFKIIMGRTLQATSRLSVRFYLGIGGAVAVTMIASLVAWFSFVRVGDAQTQVSENIPGMVGAFLLAQQGNSLVAAAPRMTAAATREDFDRVLEGIAEARGLFESRLNELMRTGEGSAGASDIRASAEALIANILAIEESVDKSFTLAQRSRELSQELVTLQQELERQLLEVIDDQYFYTVTGYRDLGRPPAPSREHFTETEFQRFRYLKGLEAASNVGTQILASVFNISDLRQLEPLRERFETAVQGINRSMDNLGGSSLLSPQLTESFDLLIRLGNGPEGSFALRAQALALADGQQELLKANRDLALNLGAQVESNVSDARARSLDATTEATDSISTARNLLLWINLLTIAGALAIAWLYVGRLVERIRQLSDKMRSMASGELEGEVMVSGRDEVAQMGTALEVFRRNSLKAQRLDLVEKLAEELRGKNEELEKVLEELRRTQDQVVMQEKLAALGQLTAGVAHEIKNPLNFVKNFAEGSVELLDELRGIVGSSEGKELTADQRKTLGDIGDDLDENLSSILRNGDRANRIVQDMLGMGRDTGEWQSVDINRLLMDHVKLAYHSARAADPNFQLTIAEDLDPEVGEIEAIPHDMGRVFLNMVTNACYATDEKRKRIEDKTGARIKVGEGYEPTLTVSTKRGSGGVTVTIRDNGIGIPTELVEKIFNPFFTTKPPDKGTGLGLSLSNDIVVEHGGSIEVSTEADEYTEMRVELPFKAAASQGEPAGESAAAD